MKTFYTGLFLAAALCYSMLAIAQDQQKIATIQQKLVAEKTDTGKANLLHDLFVQYREYDSAKAVSYADQSISLSHKANFLKGESLALLNKGIFLNLNGELEEAEKLIQQSLAIRKKSNDLAGQGYCLRALGNIQFDKNDYSKALEYYLAAEPKFDQAHDLKGLSGDYIWIGNVFNDGLHQYDKAVFYFDKSLAIATQLKDSSLISYAYNNLGTAYYFDKKYKEALSYYHRSKNIKNELGDIRGVAVAHSNISNVHFDQQRYDSAVFYNDSALLVRIKQGDKKGMAISYANGGNIFLMQKNYESAFSYYEKGIYIGNDIGFKEPVIEGYNGLSKYYEAKNDAPKALAYYKKYKEANDSVFNSDITNQLATLEAKYQTAKKEQQIQQQRFEISRKTAWIWGIGMLFVLTALLGYSYYRRYKLRQEKKLQAEIMHQQEMATKDILRAEENERERIARELHDGVGQLMSAAKMNLSAMESDLAFTDVSQKNAYEKIVSLVDESCKEVRTVSHQMMPNALLKKGLANAVREFIDKIDNRVLKIELYSEGLNEPIDPNTESVLYRVIQECVNNVIKHSGANQLDISLIKDTDGISITIEDNGSGFNSNNISREKADGIGLKNIYTRIEYLKGTVDFDSTPGKGTLVAIHVPG